MMIKTNFPVRGRKLFDMIDSMSFSCTKIKTNFPVRGRKPVEHCCGKNFSLVIKTNFPVRGRKRISTS